MTKVEMRIDQLIADAIRAEDDSDGNLIAQAFNQGLLVPCAPVAGRRTSENLTPEQRFAVAVLQQAMREYRVDFHRFHKLAEAGYGRRSRRRIAKRMLETENWFFTPDPGVQWPIELVAEAIGCDMDRLRKLIVRWIEEKCP